MRRHFFAACSLALIAAVPADAVPPAPFSIGACNEWSPLQDQYPYDAGRHYTVLSSDPVWVGDGPVVVTCAVQIGNDITHAAPDRVAVSSPASYGVAAVPPAAVVYDVDGWFSLCTSVSVAGGRTWYLDATTGRWTTDPGVDCWTLSYGPPPLEITSAVTVFGDRLAGPHADPVVCPVLATSPVLRDYDAPVWVAPDGDVWLGGWRTWDC